MSGRRTVIRIGTLGVTGTRFSEALFRHTLAERIAGEGGDLNRDATARLVRDAATRAGDGGRS